MAGPVNPACDGTPPLTEEDKTGQAVLTVLLHAHPAQRSIDEVVRELTDDPDEFAARDAIHNAVRNLVCAGLLHRNGQFVFATRAAVRFDELAV
jgi:hypothetical protein